MSASVLYDAPGPKARRRNRIYTVVGSLLVAGLIGYAVWRLADRDQFNPDRWEIFNFTNVQNQVVDGLTTTLKVFALAAVLSLALGTVLAVGRLSDHTAVRVLATGFIEIFRAVPLLITIYALWVLFLTYKSDLGFEGNQPSYWALVIGLTIYNGSVQAEVLRAGINAVPKGQKEAASAIGLRKTQVMTSVLLPQAVRSMLPTIVSQLVVTLKDTSLGYIITYGELLYAARRLANNITVNDENPYVQVIIVTGTIYVAMCLALSGLANWIERRGRRAKTGIAVAAAGEPAEGAVAGTAAPLGLDAPPEDAPPDKPGA